MKPSAVWWRNMSRSRVAYPVEAMPFQAALAGLPGRARPTPFWPLRQDDFVIHPDLNPGA